MNLIWDLASLQQTPQTFPAIGLEEPDLQALFYRTLDWKGRETRTFAYIGLPEQAKHEKVPAMVLIHGGGGTAFPEWVRLWNERGYAAITMDCCGCTSGGDHSNRPRHEWGGPKGWGGWDQTGWNAKDQWTYHAVADVILAHSLLRSLPEVDESRVGVTGISWGGFLTNIVAGLDSRFAMAAPVYGCGFIAQNEFFSKLLPEDEQQSQSWLRYWEPSHYLPSAAMPMLWVNGTNDFAYPLDVHQMSYRLPSGPRTLSIRIHMEHSQPAGSHVPEIAAFANAVLKNGQPLCKCIDQGHEKGVAWAHFDSEEPLREAVLCFTRDNGLWEPRHWNETAATIEDTTVSAKLPAGTSAYFFNVKDARDLTTSSEMQQSSEIT